MTQPLRPVGLWRVQDGVPAPAADVTAAEEPLEIRLGAEPFAVIMRTPGHDRELVAGFLLAERVIRSPDDLGTLEYCTRQGREAGNVVSITLAPGVDLDGRLRERRRVVMNASCGLCGRATIDSLTVEAPPLAPGWTLAPDAIRALPGRLSGLQTGFQATGGFHAAGLFDREGRMDRVFEDVGRHNAVDKAIGRRLLEDRFPVDGAGLFVSGRVSFEIVQKAFLAGVPVVCAVSAPSSLAIELAHDAGVTLVGFVRGDTFNVYSHPQRIGIDAVPPSYGPD